MSEKEQNPERKINRRDFMVKGSKLGAAAIATGAAVLACESKDRSISTKPGLFTA